MPFLNRKRVLKLAAEFPEDLIEDKVEAFFGRVSAVLGNPDQGSGYDVIGRPGTESDRFSCTLGVFASTALLACYRLIDLSQNLRQRPESFECIM